MTEVWELGVSWIGAAAIAFAVLFLRDYYLYGRHQSTELIRSIAEKRLEKLYSPLMAIIAASQAQYGEKTLFVSKKGGKDAGGGEKEQLDSIIRQYYYLASAELRPMLAKIYGAGFYASSVSASDLVGTIEREFAELERQFHHGHPTERH